MTDETQRKLVKHQFPDTGANTSFVDLRKDLWRPLWTLSIPNSPHAQDQGRLVFKKLREWRKVHETSWERPAMLAVNHSPEEIKELEDQLGGRGGSKKESVYNIISKKKKKMRVNAVLNQRANSIADLAAVLAELDLRGVETQQQKDDEATSRRKHEVTTMLELAEEARQGGIGKTRKRLNELTAMRVKSAKLGEPMEMSKTKMNDEVRDLNVLIVKMGFAKRSVEEASQKLPEDLSPEDTRARMAELLPSFPKPKGPVPKRGGLHARLERENAPIYSTTDVVVKWANPLDAEYAESWPETIKHEPMGFARHVAPKADDEPIMDVESFQRAKNDHIKDLPKPNKQELRWIQAQERVLGKAKKAMNEDRFYDESMSDEMAASLNPKLNAERRLPRAA